MENIERTQFVVLTGHLDDHPLPDLIRRLRVQRKSGRLQVEYPDGPGAFFFEDGQLVDAQLGTLNGVEAVHAALALDGASFNFNPLVRPPERNIDRQGQQFVRDLIESPKRESLTEIKVAGGELDTQASMPAQLQHAPRQLPLAAELSAPLEERLTAVEEAIISTSRRFSRERLIYTMVIGFLVGLSLITTLHVVSGPPRSERVSATTREALPASAPSTADGTAGAATAGALSEVPVNKDGEDAGSLRRKRGGVSPASNLDEKAEVPAGQTPDVPATAALIATRRAEVVSAARREYVVQVLVEVQDGRVTDARVWNPRPGAGASESVALKMARERRYPENFTGGERLKIRVKP